MDTVKHFTWRTTHIRWMRDNIALTDDEMAKYFGLSIWAIKEARKRNGIKKQNGGQITRPEKRKPKVYDASFNVKVTKPVLDSLHSKAKEQGKTLVAYIRENLEKLVQ